MRERKAVICTIDGCDDDQIARGMCWKHYKRQQRHGDPLVGTDRPKRNPQKLTVCSIDGCDEPYRAMGYCKPHWTRFYRYGDPLCVPQKPYAKGEQFSNAVLTDEIVLSARKRVANGEISINRLASELDVKSRTIHAAVIGETWAHLPGAVPPPGRTKLTEADVRKIRKLAEKLPVCEIAEMYSMSSAGIGNVVARRSWADVA